MKVLNVLAFCFFISVASVAQSRTDDTQQNWRFKVFLDDSPIGYHHYDIKRHGDTYQVSSKAEFNVKFLFLSVYDYFHENLEIWQDQCLNSLNSSTNDNGEVVFVNVIEDNNVLKIETPTGVVETTECLSSFAYWNPELLNTKLLLNAQTGELVDIDFKNIGKELITLGDQSIESELYQLKGKDIEINLWYSSEKEWLVLESITEGGYVLRYQRESKVQ